MRKIAILEDRKSYSNDLVTIIGLELPNVIIDAFNDVDSAILAVEEGKKWDLWIIDLMMPVGSRFSSGEADYGLATGNRFIDFLLERRRLEENIGKFSIFVVTSRNTDLDEFLNKKEVIHEFQKSQITQVDLAKQVRLHFESLGK